MFFIGFHLVAMKKVHIITYIGLTKVIKMLLIIPRINVFFLIKIYVQSVRLRRKLHIFVILYLGLATSGVLIVFRKIVHWS